MIPPAFTLTGPIIIGAQLHGNPVYLGLAITFALVDFLVPSPWPWSSASRRNAEPAPELAPAH